LKKSVERREVKEQLDTAVQRQGEKEALSGERKRSKKDLRSKKGQER